MVRLKDIAARLELGISTVSAVLNNKNYCYVSEAKKQLIRETAEEMGYLPNRMSRGIKGLPTNTVGLIGSLLATPITSSLVAQLCNLLYEHGYFVLLADSSHEASREKILINEFLSRGVDGLLIQPCRTKEELELIIKGRVPYVCFNHENFGGANVTMNRRDSSLMAVEHLITVHKHHKIGFVTSRKKSNLEKFEGFKLALNQHGIPFSNELCIEIPSEFDTAAAVGKITASGLSAVFCSNDFIAGYLIKSLNAAGIKVPEDVAVIGFDGMDMICELVQPSLTSVKHPVSAVAGQTLQLLMQKLDGREVEEKTYYIESKLRIGQSCGCK